MELYGTSKYLFSPGGATIQHSRGCTLSCSFCAWWTMMATRKENPDGSVTLTPRWRTFGVDRHLEEVELLVKRYDKKCMMYVDESWNINPKFNLAFSEEVIRRKLPIKWFAFMRADAMLRDHKTGVLAKMAEAGMAHICIGVERAEDVDLKNWNKKTYSTSQTIEVFRILKDNHPEVFRQGTFIVGVRDETKDSMWKQAALAKKLDLDYPAFHPVTPVPGTKVYEEAKKNDWIELPDFKNFDWMTPVMRSEYLTREEIAWQIYEMNKALVTPTWLLKGLTDKTPYRQHMYMWWAKVASNMALDMVKKRVNPFKTRDYMNLVKPAWYNN
jgi:anaerobic magnesium-protoporphyrin IX monomethyl ester cyclase